jgi:hypothetical protein
MAFDFIQTKHINAGQMWRQTFVDTVAKAVQAKPNQRRPHTFISSKPGLGKSHTTQYLLNKYQVNYLPISGHPSLWNFTVQLAEIVYHLPKTQSAIIWVDDCDKIFTTETNCNVLKNMLEGHKKLAYNVDVSNNIVKIRNGGNDFLADIVDSFRTKNGLGLEIDCSNLVFIFTSNIFLPDADRVTQAEGKKEYNQIVGQHALRDRCKTKDLVMEWQDHWGWIADVVINDDVLLDIFGKKNKKAEEVILKFLWDKWPNLKEKSVRTAEKLAEDMVDYPSNYENHWIANYVKI